jgi:hypothetical protein
VDPAAGTPDPDRFVEAEAFAGVRTASLTIASVSWTDPGTGVDVKAGASEPAVSATGVTAF